MFLCQKLAAGDFKANTGEIIHDILGAANKVSSSLTTSHCTKGQAWN